MRCFSFRLLASTALPYCLLCTIVTAQAQKNPSLEVIGLKTEYLSEPIGLDHPTPRFTWRVTTSTPAFEQKTYRIIVSDDAKFGTKTLVWDSKWVNSDKTLVEYSGNALKPFTQYYWRVEVKGTNKNYGQASSHFEMGVVNSGNWKGSWISDSENNDTKPAPYFRKAFVAEKEIRSARAYIAVAGLYELYINGAKIGNHSLDPVYTRFDRRNLYVTHDITTALTNGQNTIGVILGNGWYNHQSTAVWNFHNAPWRNRPAFCMDIRITYTDGSTALVSTGKDWKTALSPIIFNSIYTGEHYDATQEIEGWHTSAYNDSGWQSVIYRTAPSRNITAQAMHPIRRVEKLLAKKLNRLDDTTYVFDFGRNISGICEISIAGKKGTVICLKHGERLTSAGRVDLSNIDVHYRPKDRSDPFATDIFILSGVGTDTFAPRFNYKGFQYLEISSNRPIKLGKDQAVAYFLHSDVPAIGRIKSSNETINKIWAATNASYLSNLFGYPTDCPQREKNGWTGDAVIANETGLYSFDGITVYEKWLADHRDEQQPNGVLPSIVPTGGWGYEWGNGPDWTSSIALIPWNLYLFYGDPKPLADCYDNIKRYVDHITEISPSGLTTWGLGDWVPVKSKAPVELTSTCYYYADVIVLAKAAQLLGKSTDATQYFALADRIKNAFNDKYLNNETGLYGTGLQTELSVPLYWGLAPDSLKAKIAASLAKRVQADGMQLDVGLLGQKAILNALSEYGYADIAYQLAARESYPSWGWWIKNGATTLYENWDIQAQNDISLNHIMFGEIGAWLYKGLGGIFPDEQEPGFKHIRFRPNFVNGLEVFEAVHEGPYGPIRSSWSGNSGGTIQYRIEIPSNSRGTVFFGNSSVKSVKHLGKPLKINTVPLQSGIHEFEVTVH